MKRKIYIIISALILVVAIIGTTFALVYFRSENTSVNLTFEPDFGKYINYKSGELIFDGDSLVPGADYTSGVSTEIEFWKTPNAHNMDIYGHIYLDIDLASQDLLDMEGLKWTVTSNNLKISEGSFVGYTKDSSLPLLVNHKLLSNLTKFQIYIWIDKNGIIYDSVSGEDFSVTIRCEATSSEYNIVNDPGEENVFEYTGSIELINLKSGIYILEVWGAQGGYAMNETYRGGYGGYSSGYVDLDNSTDLYVVVGGQGGNGIKVANTSNAGGFNGGANSSASSSVYIGSGGGATHIAFSSGELHSLSGNIDDVLIVAGGGGAGGYISSTSNGTGGDAGGYIGNAGVTTNDKYEVGYGGNQSSGGTGAYNSKGTFGKGASASLHSSAGGGGGFYGGGASYASSSGGGSGYIGNSRLIDKVMYCYGCLESDDIDTKTISTTMVSDVAKSNYAKMGNGCAKITNLLSVPVKLISRKKIVVGTDYDFKAMARSEIGEDFTIIESTYESAMELSTGEYQIRYIVLDDTNNKYIYYQKIDIVE